jgi:MATE family multidrug resistance protein
MPFAAASFAYSALLVGFGRTRVLIPATILLTVTNALLDYILVFGKLGFSPMGIQGSAIGSVGAEVLTFLFLTVYVATRSEARRHGIFRFVARGRRSLVRLVRLSVPISLQGITEEVRWFVFFLVLERVGAVALAVANVVYCCYTVFRIPTEAFAETTCSMVSRLVGRDRPDRIESVVRESIMAAGLVSLPLMTIALVAPEWVLSAFALDGAMLHAGAASLRVVALAMLIVVPAEMWLTAVLGTGDTPAALGIEILLTIVMLGATYVAAVLLSGSLALVWCSLGLASLVALVASYGWMKSGNWRRVAY